MTHLRIGVVGCGTGGPTAALFLAEAGHQVQLFERTASLAPVGAGFMLQPTGLEVLAELGLIESILEFGERLDRISCIGRGGRNILDLHYAELDSSLFAVGIHRASILDVLVQAMIARDVPVHLDHEVRAVEDRPDGTYLRTNRGQHGPYDLIVAADGARSAMRELVGIRCLVSRYKWGALWFMGFDTERVFHDELYQALKGTSQMLGFLPTGTTPGGEHELLSLFWSLEVAAASELRAAGIDSWKQQVLALEPRAQGLVNQISSFDDLTVAVYHDVIMRSWHLGNVVFIGDAAHATSPQLGQGANLALLDARALAKALADEQSDVAAALRRYDRARKHNLRFYQFASRRLTPFFQSRSSLLGALRNLLLPLAMRIGPIRRQGIRTMAGLKRGIVRRSLPPPRNVLGD